MPLIFLCLFVWSCDDVRGCLPVRQGDFHGVCPFLETGRIRRKNLNGKESKNQNTPQGV